MTKKTRLQEIISRLYRQYPDSDCTLSYASDPWRLMVGAILAAQCTDLRVNVVTPALFEKYPDVFAMAEASPEDILPLIKSCGLGGSKSRSITAAARVIVANYGGRVPDTIDELVKLPGIGRKIANLVAGDCFGHPAVVIDTHAKRLLYRMGITDSDSPDKIEQEVRTLLDGADGSGLCHRLVDHGRAVCRAQNPMCGECCVRDVCKRQGVAEKE